MAITIVPVTVAVAIHKNARARLGGAAWKGPLACCKFGGELEVPTALYIPQGPSKRQWKQFNEWISCCQDAGQSGSRTRVPAHRDLLHRRRAPLVERNRIRSRPKLNFYIPQKHLARVQG